LHAAGIGETSVLLNSAEALYVPSEITPRPVPFSRIKGPRIDISPLNTDLSIVTSLTTLFELSYSFKVRGVLSFRILEF